MHIPDETLRAKLDGELPAEALSGVEEHLAACRRCREHASELAARAERVANLLAALPQDLEPDVAVAWSRTQARLGESRRRAWLPAGLPAWFPARLSPVFAALAIVAVLIVSGPARAVAQKLLAMLRVKNVVVVPINTNVLSKDKGRLFGDFLGSSSKVIKDEKPQPVTDREDASRIAGFAVRLPSILTERPRITVEGEHEVQFTVDYQRAQTLVSLLGRPDLQLPQEINGARIAVHIPRGVSAAYGDCPKPGPGGIPNDPSANCMMVAQVPAPTVVTVPELNLAAVAEIALQVAGMPSDEARTFSRTIDWTSTLAIPVPIGLGNYETVTVDGVSGVFLSGRFHSSLPMQYAVVWVKNGVIYHVGGIGNASMALPAAQSLQ